ncbi:hypothetical protein GX831_03940 [bacterium]|jgi:replication initiation and membrane attachment protein|nr:hypothetical protein [bacterium]
MVEKINFKVSNPYEIVLCSYISDYDRKILHRLYQPICGAGAIALFNTLWSELEADKTISSLEKSHSILLANLGCDVDEFISYRKQLEGLGLIKTLYHQRGCYIYLLYAPKSPKEFFDYELFDVLLQRKLGRVEYDRVRTYFSLSHYDKENCIDISQSFNDVYVTPDGPYKFKGVADIIGHQSADLKLSFDFQTFYASLKDYFIKKEAFTKEIEEEIALLATTYGWSVSEMINIVYKSLDNTGKIDILRLQKFARMGKVSQPVNKPAETQKVDTGNAALDKKIELFNRLTPLEFLMLKNGGVQPVERDARLIKELIVTTKLPDPVINVLLDYSLANNNNRLVRNYLQAVASSLMRSKISDAYEAMIYLTEPTSKSRAKSKAKEPVVKEKEEPIKVSDQEMAESLRILQELKKGRK